jgi:hypothetical protein
MYGKDLIVLEILNNMSKLWLIGITQNSLKDIDEMTADIMPFINGLVFVDHFSNDGTKELLDSRKGDGEIISIPFLNNHSWSMNACLNSDKIQLNDWFILLDSSERLSIDFATNISNFIKELEKYNVKTVYHYSKLVMAQYNPNMMFIGSPHWGLHNAQSPASRLEDSFPIPRHCIYSTRNQTRPADHWINHFLKYYLYKTSNHLLLGREDNIKEFSVHEEIRNKFRIYCLDILNINPLKVDSLLEYCKNNTLDYQIKWFFNFEPILNDFYCYRVLSHSLEEVKKRRDNKELFKIE